MDPQSNWPLMHGYSATLSTLHTPHSCMGRWMASNRRQAGVKGGGQVHDISRDYLGAAPALPDSPRGGRGGGRCTQLPSLTGGSRSTSSTTSSPMGLSPTSSSSSLASVGGDTQAQAARRNMLMVGGTSLRLPELRSRSSLA